MTDILTGVLTRGTARGRGISNMACAGKTGTTSDKKDGWFCGFTPYYTTAVWVGYDAPQTLDDLYGNTYPLTIWHDYMENIHENLEPAEFTDYRTNTKSSKKKNEEEEEFQTTEPTVEPDASEGPEGEPTRKPKTTNKPKATRTPKPQAATEPPADPGDDGDDMDDIPDDGGDTVDIPEE